MTKHPLMLEPDELVLEAVRVAIQHVQECRKDSHIVASDWIVEEFHGPHTNESTCWCYPMVIYRDPLSGCQVFVHRKLEV